VEVLAGIPAAYQRTIAYDNPAMEAAIAAHSLDLDAHPALIAKADVANVQKFLVDSDNATFADLCSLFNALVDALQAPRA
jgi:hypothetical protein